MIVQFNMDDQEWLAGFAYGMGRVSSFYIAETQKYREGKYTADRLQSLLNSSLEANPTEIINGRLSELERRLARLERDNNQLEDKIQLLELSANEKYGTF